MPTRRKRARYHYLPEKGVSPRCQSRRALPNQGRSAPGSAHLISSSGDDLPRRSLPVITCFELLLLYLGSPSSELLSTIPLPRRALLWALVLLALSLVFPTTWSDRPLAPSPYERMQRTLARLSAVVPAWSTTSSGTPSATSAPSRGTMSSARQDGAEINTTPAEWRQELEALPSLEQLGGAIPAVFLAHGSPSLITPKRLADARGSPISAIQGIDGPLAHFLKDLGPALVEKYKPKALVVLSAHFETPGGGITTDYGDDNPLLFDYFGFPDE